MSFDFDSVSGNDYIGLLIRIELSEDDKILR